jgi:hypothetical protein
MYYVCKRDVFVAKDEQKLNINLAFGLVRNRGHAEDWKTALLVSVRIQLHIGSKIRPLNDSHEIVKTKKILVFINKIVRLNTLY